LVAYAVETSWFVKQFRGRGSKHETWVGFVAGIGASGAAGIFLAITLLGCNEKSFNWLESLACSWSLFSLGLLGSIVGLFPYVLYGWAHQLNTEYPNE
jgi:hypothetical protein